MTAKPPGHERPAPESGGPAALSAQPSRTYWTRLAGVAWTSVGVNLLSFGLVWAATDHSAALAGLLLLISTIPRVTLSLLGGAVADRYGPARIMLGSDVLMTAVMAALALFLLGRDASPALLVLAAAALSVTLAFYEPAAGAIPKFLVPPAALPRAVSARQLVAHGSQLVGPVLGGLAVGFAGLPLAFALGGAGFAGMAVILLALRRRMPMRPPHRHDGAAGEPGLWSRMGAGLSVVLRSPVLRGISVLVAAFAAFVIPFSALLVPVLARAREWDAAAAGTIAGTYGGGVALVAALVMWRRGFERAGLAVIGGIMLAGVGMVSFAFVPTAGVGLAAGLLVGVGTGLFVTHLGPVFVAAAPAEAMSRVSAVLLMAQSLPLLVANPGLGAAAERLPPGVVVAVWGGAAVATAVLALTSTALRRMRRPD